MTHTTNPDTSKINAALERTWRRIRDLHPDVPAAVIVLGTAAYTERVTYLGHYAPARWTRSDDAERLPEVLIAGENLKSMRELLHVLLHEAAHGLAHARNVEDTSREGRYHNKRFAALAEELGLDVNKDPKIGHRTQITDATAERYAAQLADLEAAHDATGRAVRIEPRRAKRSKNDQTDDHDADDRDDQADDASDDSEPKRRNPPEIAARCACNRRIKIAFRGLDAGEIFCGKCGTAFEPAD